MATLLRTFFRLLTLLFFAGNTLLLILIILSGATDSYPVNRFYWVQGDTSGIPNAPDLTRWTFWGACSRSDGTTTCGGNLSPAYPISPVDNFVTQTNVPHKFIADRDAFYYLTRFSFCFFWISLAFIGISFLIYIGSWCSYGISQVVWLLTTIGCLFNVTAVVLQTAAAVMARNAFSDDNRAAGLGADLFGIAWASVFLCLVEAIFTFIEYIQRVRRNINGYTEPKVATVEHRPFKSFFLGRSDTYPTEEPVLSANDPYATTAVTNTNAAAPQESQQRGINFFTVRKSQKSTNDDDSV